MPAYEKPPAWPGDVYSIPNRCLRSNAEATDPATPKPPPHPRKLQRSGKRSAHQPPGHGCTYKSAWYPVQCAATMPDAAQAGSWQGACERGGLGAPFAFNQRHLRSKCTGRTLAAGRPLPLAASFFLYSFFAGEERMEPPEGAGPFAWWIFRRKDFQIELFRLKQ